MKILIPFVLLLLSSCASLKKGEMKLYVFDCGNVDVRDISLFSPGVDKGKKKKLVVSCYLIKHPKGTLIWDTGLNDGIAKMKRGVKAFGGKMRLKVKKTLISQLKEIGVAPKDITYVGFSHFHGDHSGNANYFTNSKIILQKEEYEAAFGKDAKKFGFHPDFYKEIKNNVFMKLSGDYDLFGDGSVVIKRAVGHTPGHQVLSLNLPDTGKIVLSGDLYHFRKNREFKRVPSFNFDKYKSLESMHNIEEFLKEEQAELWIQHDPEDRKTTRLSPLFYE